MKVLIVADIHGNGAALSAVLFSGAAYDLVLCLGDVVGYYSQVNEVIDTLRDVGAICIRGNHDQMVIKNEYAGTNDAVRFGIEVARNRLNSANMRWLSGLPLSLGLEIDNRSFFLVHASPWDPLNEYLYPDSANLPLLDQFNYDVIAYGHTHKESLAQAANGHWAINPGSVGQSRTKRGIAMGVVFCTTTMRASLLEVPYNAEQLIDDCEGMGAGGWVRTSLGSTAC